VSRLPPPDQAQRDAALAERVQNLVIDAGAGTGKTTILVERLVAMLAPPDGAGAIPIERVAAITFTRKAAGELRLRIRERLLSELAKAGGSAREAPLRAALAGLDTAHVGTIHSFADRLLRLRPVEAGLSPSYDVVEDDTALLRETFAVLMQAVEGGTLGAELQGASVAPRADEATRTLLDALAAGLEAESEEREWDTRYGLDALFEGFIRNRDVPPLDVPPAALDLDAFRGFAGEFLALARGVAPGPYGAEWVLRTAALLQRLRRVDDPIRMYRELRRQIDRAPRYRVTLRNTFGGDKAAWKVWKSWLGDDRDRPGSLRDDLLAPLRRWMATRLARLFPVVVELYERVKARRRQLDQLDLLVKLRDLLRDDRRARAAYQALFDHVFVDEFQDTDPLQAEIVLYLCEASPAAATWLEVRPAPGRLTLVGDPKQSIYRFRRADVAMYDRVRRILVGAGAREVELSANFRSTPSLIAWLNDRFDRILMTSPDRRFDAAEGRVFNRALLPGRADDAGPAVHLMPYEFGDGADHTVDECRGLEGAALARYLRWLVEASGTRVLDPIERRPRAVGYGDIAVLAISTWRLRLLFPVLDAAGVPYSSRGGTLFLSDPLHRQFLLGLRSVADREDGVAEAALLRPPFFAVDLADLAREVDAAGPVPERLAQARGLVRELRRRRHERSVGATARDLLEQTAFGRAVAQGPNGSQRLARLRELCLALEQVAAAEGLDFDAATARAREWVAHPVPLDPPHPVGSEAVQVLTVHQAKGLEFPVVILWDGLGQWNALFQPAPWRQDREERGWLMNLPGLSWEEPAGLALRTTEGRYLDAERPRVVYVAATRARDLLVVPCAGGVKPGRHICGDLVAETPEALVRRLPRYVPGVEEPDWARARPAPAPARVEDGATTSEEADRRWSAAAVAAARPRLAPSSVTGSVRPEEPVEDELAAEPAKRKQRVGRHGALFGSTVHRAIGLALADEALSPAEAVRRAARMTALGEHLTEAEEDVARALEALAREGLRRRPGPDLQLEYALAGPWEEGLLVSGYADLVAVTGGRLDVLDFKTDAPPASSVEVDHAQYVAQVRAYGRLLQTAALADDRALRCGLLFTANGTIEWVAPAPGALAGARAPRL
jgi:ATP-dependent helicase/nuclease subunit A